MQRKILYWIFLLMSSFRISLSYLKYQVLKFEMYVKELHSFDAEGKVHSSAHTHVSLGQLTWNPFVEFLYFAEWLYVIKDWRRRSSGVSLLALVSFDAGPIQSRLVIVRSPIAVSGWPCYQPPGLGFSTRNFKKQLYPSLPSTIFIINVSQTTNIVKLNTVLEIGA